jgi:hypothetical protein
MIREKFQRSGFDYRDLRDLCLFLYTLLGIGMNFFVTLINVDIYHEGDKFPALVVMSDGGMIFRDVNNIYGFLQTLVQLPFIELFGAQLIVSRLVGFAIKLLSVILFIFVLTLLTSKRLAIFAGATWLVITPSWTNLVSEKFTNGFAWPTHYGVLFLLLSIILYPRKNGLGSFRKGLFFLSSFSLALAWSARLEFIASWIACLFILLVQFKRKKISRVELSSWISGGLSFFLIALYWLHHNGALWGWFEQTILAWFSDPPAQPKMTAIWFGMNLFSFMGIAALGLMCVFVFLSMGHRKVLGAVISISLILLFIYLGQLLQDYKVSSYHPGAWFFEMSNRGLLSFVNIFFALGLYSSCVVIYNFLLRKNSRHSSELILLVSALNISLLSMLHIVNADYLHMFVFTYVLSSVWYLGALEFSNLMLQEKVYRSIISSVSVFAILAIFSFTTTATKPTFPYRTSVLSGLSDQDVFSRNSIDRTMTTVAKYSSEGIWSFCISGLPTVASGAYASKDKWLWNLQPEPWMLKRWAQVGVGDYMYVCALSVGEQKILETNLQERNIILVHEGDGFAIYRARQELL